MIETHELTKVYQGGSGRVEAVRDVTLRAAAGEFVAVQGPSGCGKSTLLLAAGALLMPTGGRVRVDGQDPYALSSEARAKFRARTIGFVFQQFHLMPYLNVLDNILVPAIALPARDAQDRAAELAAHFGLADRACHVPAELSVGERQRVALARALLNRPNVLLADEPTGNLDAANAEIVLGHLAEFAQAGGTVLLVTHDPRAAHYAHRTLDMEDGKIADGAGREPSG